MRFPWHGTQGHIQAFPDTWVQRCRGAAKGMGRSHAFRPLHETGKCHEAARACLESAGVAMCCPNNRTLAPPRVHLSHPPLEMRAARCRNSEHWSSFSGPVEREASSDKGRTTRITPHTGATGLSSRKRGLAHTHLRFLMASASGSASSSPARISHGFCSSRHVSAQTRSCTPAVPRCLRADQRP